MCWLFEKIYCSLLQSIWVKKSYPLIPQKINGLGVGFIILKQNNISSISVAKHKIKNTIHRMVFFVFVRMSLGIRTELRNAISHRARRSRETESLFGSQRKTDTILSAFLAENQQHENIGRELVFSADLCYNGSSKKAFLREEGGTRSVTEGACVALGLE